MKKKMYICGKVTGQEPEYCHEKFEKAETLAKGLGFHPVNPLLLVKNRFKDPPTWEEAMKVCITELLTCDYILQLDDAKHSPGATLEMEIAHKLSIPIVSIANDREIVISKDAQPCVSDNTDNNLTPESHE